MKPLFDNPNDPKVEYPCELPIKVIGHATPAFEQAVHEIVHSLYADFDGQTLGRNQSRTGKYNSMTFTFRADSREHLEQLYQALTASEHVVWAM